MAAGFPSGTNTFVPSFDASGQLTVAFSRNPKDFPINKWSALTPVKKSTGYYLRITAENAARVINTDLSEFVWHDGNDAPNGSWGLESFQFIPFNTTRYAYPFRIGYKANEQADWKILAAHAAFAAQQAMTARSYKLIQLALTTGGYGSNTDTATNLGGGFWTAGTSTSPIIQKTINAARIAIHKATLGTVKEKDLVLVIDPTIATQMATSAEIHDYVKSSPYALAQIRGDVENQNGMWGLPEVLYGVKLVVEDTVRVSTKKGATTSTGYAWDGNSAVLCARPSQLTSVAGGPSFGAFHVMAYEEMTVEQKDDPDNRRINARVVEDNDVQFVAPAAAYLIQHTLS